MKTAQHSPARSSVDRSRWAILVIAAFALGIRLLNGYLSAGVPFRAHPVGDAAGYLEWAQRIAGGELVGREGFYQAPLYPYVLALVSTLTGESVAGVIIMQSIFGAMGVALLGMAARRLFSGEAGIVVAILAAIYPPAIFFDGIVQKGSLSFLLTTGMLLLAVRGRQRSSGVDNVLCGIVLGLLCITRENAIVWIPVIATWILLHPGAKLIRRRVWMVGQFTIGMLAVLAPVASVNFAATGQFAISTFQAGPNFYIGNHLGATGRYVPLVRGHETPEYERADAKHLAEQERGRSLSPQEVSAFWFDRAYADIKEEPAAWMGLLAKKWAMVWNWYEVSDVESQYIYAEHSFALRFPGYVFHFGVLGPMAALGVAVTIRRWRELWLLYALLITMALSVCLFYVMARYRYPIVPVMLMFGGAGVVELFRAVRDRRFRELAYTALPVLAATFFCNLHVHEERQLDGLARMNVGAALARSGDVAGALSYFHGAVQLNPSSAEARNNLAQALALLDHFDEAAGHYRTALRIEPNLVGVHFNLAVALERLGRPGAALEHYLLELSLNEGDVEARAAVHRLRGE